jgi:hypothetical protein
MPILHQTLQPDAVAVHYYPFDTLQLLRSHLHPKYAIFEAGRKLGGLDASLATNLADRYPSLVGIVCISPGHEIHLIRMTMEVTT